VRVLLRIIAVVFVAIGLFLIYADVHAMASAGGARAGVAVIYAVIAIALGFAASRLWRRSRPGASAA
jgi:hypothetical protein